ncbi:hypothetical protein SEA_C3PO_80 [Corynebacterium phage C3PO]|uniref:Pentapeptide repeat protein n=2 Tax=Corynebacterium virus C3PO TaxID=2560393 RepID=A0A3G3LW95_9CAUD|nr:hypothetical protein FDJ10_gp63 [Corynebacterium phage C3PO]ATW58479.1 hypothetical protein SEA_C3PO_80 [Corynebacterium phage C3PO]AYQ98376.1 hypothetical protein CRUELLA_80 [Corynebacterium phage Cruella]
MNHDDVIDLLREAWERGEHAKLYGENLSGADLSGAELRDTDLRIANMHGANLRFANLRGADLRFSNLRGADLYRANLYGANLCDADLRYANLAMTRWDGFAIDGLHPYRILLIPTPIGWQMTIGCWEGTPENLSTLIAGDTWPEAEGDEITRRRPMLEAALHMVEAHIAAHPHVIDDLKERWEYPQVGVAAF